MCQSYSNRKYSIWHVLTRFYRYVMETYPHLDNSIYDVIERVMRPLALRQTRRPRSDRAKARHSVSSTSANHNLGSSSHQGDDDEDDGASHASTPSPTTILTLFINSTTKSTICLPLPSKPMKLSLHDKPPCSTKRNECMRRCAEGSSHLERH
ncbi:hypothetical protein Tco_1498377 [Tanacetum coccineum]